MRLDPMTMSAVHPDTTADIVGHVHPGRPLRSENVPLLEDKEYGETSVFTATNLLRESRRQHGLGNTPVPQVCLLDPDGDVVRHLVATGGARRHEDWACYHSELWTTRIGDRTIGIVPCAVGGSYAVLVAEQLVASGCDLIISVTSAGRIAPMGAPPYFVLVTEALRDEGTSHHYLPPSEWARLGRPILELLRDAMGELDEPVHIGRSWTTDAPFRETTTAIDAAHRRGINAVEMEAASLYAFAAAGDHDVVCVAHVTNDMATDGDDFEKGEDAGTHRILAIVIAIADRLRPLGPAEDATQWSSDHWDRTYVDRGDEVSWYQDSPTQALDLIRITGVPTSGAVIDIGGGTSRLVDELIKRGYRDLTVLDISAAALSRVRERSRNRTTPADLDLSLVATDLLGWDPPKRYALWHDRAVLHFLTADTDRERYRRLLEMAVEPGGVVIIGTFAPDGPDRCSGLPVRRHSAEELVAFLEPHFESIETRREVHTTPWGAPQPFTWVAARRS